MRHVRSKLANEAELHKTIHVTKGCDHGAEGAHAIERRHSIIGFKSNLQKKIEKDLSDEMVDLMKMLQFKVD